MMRLIRECYQGTLVVAGGFDRDEGEDWVLNGKADLIAFPFLPMYMRHGTLKELK